MEKAPLISMHKKWVDLIKQGLKLKELRKWIPKEYVGPVYVCSTKSSGGSGKVEFSFWFEGYDTIKNIYDGIYDDKFIYDFDGKLDLPIKLCLKIQQINDYGKGKTLYAWHINKLEVFDKPKELSEFYKINSHIPSNDPNMEEFDDMYEDGRLTKAPQKMVWVWV